MLVSEMHRPGPAAALTPSWLRSGCIDKEANKWPYPLPDLTHLPTNLAAIVYDSYASIPLIESSACKKCCTITLYIFCTYIQAQPQISPAQ